MPKLISEINQLQQLGPNVKEGVVYQPSRGFFKIVYQTLNLKNEMARFHKNLKWRNFTKI